MKSDLPTDIQRKRPREVSLEYRLKEGHLKDATTIEGVMRPETTVLIHLTDRHGHLEFTGEDVAAQRDLPVHHGPLSLLPQEHPALAGRSPGYPEYFPTATDPLSLPFNLHRTPCDTT